jgi:hypothetical protein
MDPWYDADGEMERSGRDPVRAPGFLQEWAREPGADAN